MLVNDQVSGSLVEELAPREKAFLRRSLGS